MKLENIMTKKVFSLKEEHTLMDAAILMKNKNIGAIPIIDEDNRIKGIITDRDIVLAIANGENLKANLCDVMTKNVETLYPTDTIVDLTEMMGYSQIRRVPIVNYDDKLVGIVSLGDLSLVTYSDSFASDALAEISYNPMKIDIINYLYRS